MNIWGHRIKELRESKGYTQQEFAERAGIKLSHLSRLELGHYQSLKDDTREAIARAFEMTPAALSAYLYGGGLEVKEAPADYDPVAVIRQRLEAAETVPIPIRGYVSAGSPFPEEQQDLGNAPVARAQLGGIEKTDRLFALKVCGDSLSGDDIQDGDLVIVEPGAALVSGKIYIVKIGSEFVARHLHLEDGAVVLTSSNGKYARMKLTDLEIAGRVVLAGNWRKM